MNIPTKVKLAFTIISIVAVAIFLTNCKNNFADSGNCMENPDSTSKFLVIVGQKINIKEEVARFDSATFLYYSKFVAQYKILEKVCGNYINDTITFVSYDHYGFPAFGAYPTALLYLNVRKKGIFHEMYLYSDLYKTKDGRWASPYSNLNRYNTTGITVKPEPILFAEEVSFSIEGFTRAYTNRWFPEPFYKIDKVRKKAIAVYGNYVPELFQLQKETVLRARGVFGKPDSKEPKEIELEQSESLQLTKKDSLELLTSWNSFVNAIKTNDTSLIKNIALDSIICSACQGMPREYYENNLESIEMFIDSASLNFQKAELWPLIEKNKYKIYVIKYRDRKPKEVPLKEKESLIIFDISVPKDLKTQDAIYGQQHSFCFVKIDGRFRFYKMESN